MDNTDADAKPSYLQKAFLNVYNLSLLGGAVAASALTGDYVVGAVAAGLEAIWLLIGPDLHPFRRAVDRWHRDERMVRERQRIAKLMEALPEREWARAHALDELRKEIERDMKNNPSFETILFQVELDKLTQLHGSFVMLGTACARAESYLANTEAKELQRQVEVQKNLEKSMNDPGVRDLARKNASVLERRLETIQDIKNFLARARGQMNLIENSVRLMRDQVLTMASPAQLGDQLDDLLHGVAAVQDSVRDSEAILGRELQPIVSVGDSTSSSPESVREKV